MPRKQLSEYRAKTILCESLGQTYEGIAVSIGEVDWGKKLVSLNDAARYVVKVDQATKGRFKKGLVKLDRSSAQLFDDIIEMSAQGYEQFLIEPFMPHRAGDERYFALARDAGGIQVSVSASGGVEVEANPEAMQYYTYQTSLTLSEVGLSKTDFDNLVQAFDRHYFSFLEINPLVVGKNGTVQLLDAAVEVDDAAEFFVNGAWSGDDLRSFSSKKLTEEEKIVHELNEQSQASFNLEVLNPNGSLFLLLSGGGASVVVADEVKNLGHGDLLANYGEYSGGPNREETKLYTAQVLSLLLKSTAKQKYFVIAGGVANFTDVKTTFTGIIDALREVESDMRSQGIKVFVRRGGPNEIAGLALIRIYLTEAGILGAVHGPELVLADIVREALEGAQA